MEAEEASVVSSHTLEDHVSGVSPGLDDLWNGPDLDFTDYVPTTVAADFSAVLPLSRDNDELPLSSSYNTDAVVTSAWQTLQTESYKLPWETDFWSQFLDPSVSAVEQLSKGYKRPVPVPPVEVSTASTEVEVDRRVATKSFPKIDSFLQHIRDVPEKSWQEEREAQWEIAIRRWVALLDTWSVEGSLLVHTIQTKPSFTEKAQILVDVFYNKAPQTLMKRVNSLTRVCGVLRELGSQFPCDEEAFYRMLKFETEKGAPASRVKAAFESVVFARHVLGVDALQALIVSRRCLGAAMHQGPVCPRQASPFSVKQLMKLHAVLTEDSELWNRAMAGMTLFCIYGRARWSDAQHSEELLADRDSDGIVRFLEAKSTVHKTARALHLRHMFLPLTAPTQGVTQDNWGAQWLHVRRRLCIEDLGKFPLMPAPDSTLEPTRRPISTQEAKKWICLLLGPELVGQARISSHSCKSTFLSFLAKRGASFEDRLALGYHTNKMRIALTYSRDGASRPLALLAHVIKEIRDGLFEPDNTRSGRLKPGAGPLDRADLFADMSVHPQVPEPAVEESPREHVSTASDLQSWQKVSVVERNEGSWQQVSGSLDEPDGEQLLDGHITTDSSDSSNEGGDAWAPVIGHYTVEFLMTKLCG
eukprot:s4526_g2.t1